MEQRQQPGRSVGAEPASYGPRPGSWGADRSLGAASPSRNCEADGHFFCPSLNVVHSHSYPPSYSSQLGLNWALASSPFSSSTPDLPHYPSCGTAVMTAPSPLQPSVAPSGSLSTVQSPHSGTPVHPAQAALVSPALFSTQPSSHSWLRQ